MTQRVKNDHPIESFGCSALALGEARCCIADFGSALIQVVEGRSKTPCPFLSVAFLCGGGTRSYRTGPFGPCTWRQTARNGFPEPFPFESRGHDWVKNRSQEEHQNGTSEHSNVGTFRRFPTLESPQYIRSAHAQTLCGGILVFCARGCPSLLLPSPEANARGEGRGRDEGHVGNIA